MADYDGGSEGGVLFDDREWGDDVPDDVDLATKMSEWLNRPLREQRVNTAPRVTVTHHFLTRSRSSSTRPADASLLRSSKSRGGPALYANRPKAR